MKFGRKLMHTNNYGINDIETLSFKDSVRQRIAMYLGSADMQGVYNAIQEIANEKRYDIVKDRSSEPSLIYMSSKLDISDQVLEKLGAK